MPTAVARIAAPTSRRRRVRQRISDFAFVSIFTFLPDGYRELTTRLIVAATRLIDRRLCHAWLNNFIHDASLFPERDANLAPRSCRFHSAALLPRRGREIYDGQQ